MLKSLLFIVAGLLLLTGCGQTPTYSNYHMFLTPEPPADATSQASIGTPSSTTVGLSHCNTFTVSSGSTAQLIGKMVFDGMNFDRLTITITGAAPGWFSLWYSSNGQILFYASKGIPATSSDYVPLPIEISGQNQAGIFPQNFTGGNLMFTLTGLQDLSFNVITVFTTSGSTGTNSGQALIPPFPADPNTYKSTHSDALFNLFQQAQSCQ